jgi:hypothetical protein
MSASPTRPAHAKPNVVAVAWPDGDQDVQRAQAIKPALVGTLGLETNRAPLPQAAAGRACIAHSRACTSVPRLSSSTRCRPAAPGISLQFLSFHLSLLLCRAVLYYSVWTSVIPQRLLSAQSPCCCGTYTSSSLLFRFKVQVIISCMHVSARPKVTSAHAAQVQQHHSANARQTVRFA